MNERISRKISALSLIIVLGIVVYHSDIRYAIPRYFEFSMVYMPYFYMISGYFAFRGLTKENMGRRIAKRCYTLLVPYLLWNVVQCIYYVIVTRFNFRMTVRETIESFLFSPPCIPSWYLFSLFVMVVISLPLLRPLFKDRKKALIPLIFSFAISFAVYAWFPYAIAESFVGGGFLIKTFQYYPAFMMGAYATTLSEDAICVNKKNSLFFAIGAVLCAVIMIIPGMPEMPFIFLANIFNVLLWKAVPEDRIKGGKLFEILTEPSLFLCMAHIMLCDTYDRVLPLPDKIRFEFIRVPLAILTAYVIYYLLKLIMPPVLNLLTGGRAVKKPARS